MGGVKWRLAISTACCPSSIPNSPTRAISGGAGERTWTRPYEAPTASPMRRDTRYPKHRSLPYSCGRSTIRPAEPAATLR
jgi:hypothetical protein